MIYGMYESAAGMMVNEYRQGVLTNNIANADTTGFKRDIAVFSERLTAQDAGQRSGTGADALRDLSGGVWLGRSEIDFSEGALQHTANPLDVALAGPGFLMVEDEHGRQLTRDGRMLRQPDGRLVAAADGAAILGVGGARLSVSPTGGEISIDERGRLFQDGRFAGQLAVMDVDDYLALRKVGASRFAVDGAQPRPVATDVISGAVERSGAEPVREMVSMLEAARVYQLNAQMLTLQDQSLGRLIGATSV